MKNHKTFLSIISFCLTTIILQSCFLSTSETPDGMGQSASASVSPQNLDNSQCVTREPLDEPGKVKITVYLLCNNAVHPVHRIVPNPNLVTAESLLTVTLASLLTGVTDEERAAGFSSVFSNKTRGMINSVNISNEDEVVIDFANFADLIPNVGASAGTAGLLGQLDNTVFQFEEINSATYLFDGSCEAFSRWLESTCSISQPRVRRER